MRHRKSGRHLGRTSSHREAMFRNMTISLFEHEVIKTTLPKAKELRRVAEPLITLGKNDSVANRRLAAARLPYATRVNVKDGGFEKADKNGKVKVDVIKKLFNELGPRYSERSGGYLRIIKAGFRAGDNAPMAYVELVDRPVVEEQDEDLDTED